MEDLLSERTRRSNKGPISLVSTLLASSVPVRLHAIPPNHNGRRIVKKSHRIVFFMLPDHIQSVPIIVPGHACFCPFSPFSVKTYRHIAGKIPWRSFFKLKKHLRLCPFCAHAKKIGADFCQLAPSGVDSKHVEIAYK
jgi:hypothetical protein